MTNKTTIDGVSRRMLAALLCHVSEIHNRALVDELRAALADPVPPAGGDLVECDACPTSGGCVGKCMKAPAGGDAEKLPERRQNFSVLLGDSYDPFMKGQNIGWNFACDAWEPHVTRLQAEVERLKSDSAQLAALDDQTIKQLGDKLRISQAELTKARECIDHVMGLLRADKSTHAQHAIILYQGAPSNEFNQSAPAEESYPPCDYCGTVPDYHPWHGSGLINGEESPHIHACNECRAKLPAPADKGHGEPVADALSTGFYVTETGGGKYAINIGFRSMADMQAADQQLRDLLRSRHAEQSAPVAVVMPERDRLRDLIAESIGGDTYDCVRVWSAWGVGTMSEDDFVHVVEQEDRLYEIADACLDEVARLNEPKP